MKTLLTFLLTLIIVSLLSMGDLRKRDNEIEKLKSQRDYWHNKWKETMIYWEECECKLNKYESE